MNYLKILYYCHNLIKVGQQELLQKRRIIQKQYLKHPKPYRIFDLSLEDLYFKFHCHRLSFDGKMEILQNMVRQNENFKKLSLFGVQNIIQELSEELTSLNYNDEDEYNISQFINILHKLKYYDVQSWIAAMDNYHKQGILNWYQYTEFTHAVYDFSSYLSEPWHLNIVNDISQEAFSDFIGFVENKGNLELSDNEINLTYRHLRRFHVHAKSNHMLIIMRYFMISLKNQPISIEIYQFVFYFCMDHINIPELDNINRALFGKLVQQFYIDLNKFDDLKKIIDQFPEYIQLINVMLIYNQEIDNDIRSQFAQSILDIFIKGYLDDSAYEQIKNLNQMYKLLKDQKCFQLVNEILVLIDELTLVNLKNLKTQPQNLLSIYDAFERLEDKETFLSVIAKSELNLENVIFTNQELIQFLKKLDESDLVYYLTELLESTLIFVAQNIQDFQPDDWCFTFYLIYKYVVKDSQDQTKYEADLTLLKQYIKLRYMTSYRQTIPNDSSYYKILSVVEIETFFADDLLNLY